MKHFVPVETPPLVEILAQDKNVAQQTTSSQTTNSPPSQKKAVILTPKVATKNIVPLITSPRVKPHVTMDEKDKTPREFNQPRMAQKVASHLQEQRQTA